MSISEGEVGDPEEKRGRETKRRNGDDKRKRPEARVEDVEMRQMGLDATRDEKTR